MRTRFLAIAVCFPLTFAACRTWQPVGVPDARGSETQGRNVRVILADGSRVAMRDVVTQGDSIVGYSDTPERQRIAIARSNVRQLEARKIEGDRTAALVVGIGLGALALAAVAVIIALASIGFE